MYIFDGKNESLDRRSLQDDIRNLNFGNGDCVNSSVPQNVTFDYQGTPFSGSAAREFTARNAWVLIGQALVLMVVLCIP
jgi:hypothetical protein